MALIKCSECGKDISDKAAACPSCGNPLNNKEVDVFTIQLTKKKYKKNMVIGLVMWLVGVALFFKGVFGGSPGFVAFGLILGFVGFVTIIINRVGAWWSTG